MSTAHSAVGILGGSFDPVHFGHLRLAQEALEFFDLGEVRFVPAGRPPHREPPKVSDRHRVAMLELALQNNPSFRVDARELGKTAATYTIDTLQEIRSELGGEAPLVLFMGADQFIVLHTWRHWRGLTDVAHIMVAMRPANEPFSPDSLTPEVSAWFREHYKDDRGVMRSRAAGHVFLLGLTPLAISSTAIRASIAAGHSPRYLLPDAVLDYVRVHHLYSST